MNGGDPLSAALKMTFSGGGTGSFFPAARNVAQGNSDLLNQIDQTFYGGPAASPTPKPTPSPSPSKPTSMSLADLYNHFGVKQQVASNANGARPRIPNRSNEVFDWRHLYGQPGAYG